MERKHRKGGKRNRRGSSHFMDAALEAYGRHLALEKWREMADLQETLGLEAGQAVREVGNFSNRGAYRHIWEDCWQREVMASIGTTVMLRFAGVETAVQTALREEREHRQRRGDRALEDTVGYKTFIDHALDRLFEEEAGSLEDL